MFITINTTKSCPDIPDCMTIEEIRMATLDDEHIGMLSELVFCGLSSTKVEMQIELHPY